jgi:SAM-dependent methyltransferase
MASEGVIAVDSATASTRRVAAAVFAFALFVSAFLLFALEPMAAKSMLPKLGGTPMVWNTCVVFFQAALLVGYLAAHLATRPGQPRWVGWLYPALIAGAMIFLPLSFTRVPSADAHPAVWLLGELIRVAALPTIALSMSAPALQAWFSTTRLQGAEDPYFLYAASNAGSLLALLAYPTVIEPTLGLQPQARVWAVVFIFLAILVGASALITRKYAGAGFSRPGVGAGFSRPGVGAGFSRPSVISSAQRARWIILAFIPSSLMLGVTTHISTDIAAVPLIWVVPLALYLATFIIAFAQRSRGGAVIAERRVPLLATLVALFMASNAVLPIQFDMPLHLMTFTVIALMCHGRLAAERPPTAHLTEFYLLVSLGGMMGGLFNTLIAPAFFTRVLEYPLLLVAACAVPALYRWSTVSAGPIIRHLAYAGGIAAAAAAVNVALLGRGIDSVQLRVVALGAVGFAAFTQARRPIRFAMMIAALLLASAVTQRQYTTVLESQRTFFGTYRVTLDRGGKFYALYHGTTVHGLEAVDPSERDQPLVYYHRSGPFGQAFEQLRGLRDASDIGVIGLGVGSLAAYAAPSQRWVFFEIDPVVERIARDRRYFHFLESCGSRCAVVLGDARLSLARFERRFDAIVLDAFSSDSIPLHLLTREALTMYLEHLKPGGLLIFHVSNRYLRLAPALARLARERGLAAVEQEQVVDAADAGNGRSGSDWIVASTDAGAIAPLASDQKWKPITAPEQMRVWTDDYSNILSVLKFLN